MDPIPAIAERSLRKSRTRRRALLMLNSVGEAYLGLLSHMLGVEPKRVRGVLLGDLPHYAPDLALVTIGLVSAHDTPRGRLFRITKDGRRKARSVAKRAAKARGG